MVSFEKFPKLFAGSRPKQNWNAGHLVAVLCDSEGVNVSLESIVTLFGFGEDLLCGAVFQDWRFFEVVNECRYGEALWFSADWACRPARDRKRAPIVLRHLQVNDR